MQVTIETTKGLERRLTVGVPAEQVDKEVDQRLQKASQQVRIPGFRAGKVPMKIVRQRYGAGVRQEVVGEVMSRSFYEAVVQEKLQPAGQPTIEPKQDVTGKDLEYIATFEVLPEVVVNDLAGITVERPSADVTEADIDKMIELFREQQGSWEVVDRGAADKDQVKIDYAGTKDGEEFAGGSAQGSELVLGSGQMIAGFESGLEGAIAGDEKVLALTFPDDYHSDELKGAAVEFKVTVHEVAARKVAELTPEFFSTYGVKDGGVDEFRVEVRKNMERELKNIVRRVVKQSVMDQLQEANEVQVPAALAANEIKALKGQMFQQFGGMQGNFDESILPDDMFTEQAEKRVALGLIIRSVIESAEITADKELIQQEIAEIASTYEQPQEVVEYYNSNQELTQSIESSVLENQVVDHILALASVTEVSKSYDEVIAMGSKAQ
jgi:trigger factor|tara:strand:- start:4175 stop:5488 length:1314 start_codon:yes stop_codon:yes gene_type:complete